MIPNDYGVNKCNYGRHRQILHNYMPHATCHQSVCQRCGFRCLRPCETLKPTIMERALMDNKSGGCWGISAYDGSFIIMFFLVETFCIVTCLCSPQSTCIVPVCSQVACECLSRNSQNDKSGGLLAKSRKALTASWWRVKCPSRGDVIDHTFVPLSFGSNVIPIISDSVVCWNLGSWWWLMVLWSWNNLKMSNIPNPEVFFLVLLNWLLKIIILNGLLFLKNIYCSWRLKAGKKRRKRRVACLLFTDVWWLLLRFADSQNWGVWRPPWQSPLEVPSFTFSTPMARKHVPLLHPMRFFVGKMNFLFHRDRLGP